MFSILLKSLGKSYNRTVVACTTRKFATHEDIVVPTKEQDEKDALRIETILFDNSSVKNKPIKKEDILKNSKQIFQQETTKNIISRPLQFPNFKKFRMESESKIINDQDLGLEYLKLGLKDPRLHTLLITVRSKKRRDKNKQIIIEGRRLILEALKCGLKLNSIIFSQKEQLSEIKEMIAKAQKQFGTKVYKVPHHDLKTWSTLTTPPGIIAIFERPTLHNIVKTMSLGSATLPITVVCDNIREPNNLGSIIRTCAALPCLQVVITRGCCDPWESKALRGGCGGHFRLHIKDDVKWMEVLSLVPPEAADNFCIFIAENNLEKLQHRSSFFDYSQIEKTGTHNVVIIGGESHGVSQDAYKFMQTVGERGKCIYIPVAQGVDSLNVASALTLILYELRKYIIKSQMNKKNDIC